MPAANPVNTSAACYPDLRLTCLFCGREAVLSGRWHNATVLCTVCGLESSVEPYREQIERWQEDICRCLDQRQESHAGQLPNTKTTGKKSGEKPALR